MRLNFVHFYLNKKIWIFSIFVIGEPETRQECLLNNNKNSDFCAPLTSFDWNEVDPNLLGTSSIDTTCTIWGLETGQVLGRVNMVSGHVKTQLIAHDKEVYDIGMSTEILLFNSDSRNMSES